jgi:hypothetical protein
MERNVQNQKFFNYKVEVTLNGRTITGRFGFSPAWPITPSAWPSVMDAKRPDASARAPASTPTNSAPATRLYYASGASVKDTGDKSYELATTQSHWSMEGRPVVREANLEEYRKNPKFAQTMKPEEPPVLSCAALSESAGHDQEERHAPMGHVH